ncbi:MAG: HAMP domain-containing protein [Candidatus Methanoperedens sp.]
MKIKTKMFLELGILIAIVVVSALLTLNSSEKLSQKQTEIEAIRELSTAALDFNVENYHTQLEVWEYVYEPNEKRLKAFEGHAKTFDILFARLLDRSRSSTVTLSPESKQVIDTLEVQVPSIKQSWDSITNSIKSGKTVNETKAVVFEGEAMFDEFKFNKKVDQFITAQKEVEKQKDEELNQLMKQQLLLVSIMALVLIVSFLYYMYSFSSNVLKPIAKLTETTDAISKGNANIQPLEITSKDEIGELTEAFNRMISTAKFLMEDRKV